MAISAYNDVDTTVSKSTMRDYDCDTDAISEPSVGFSYGTELLFDLETNSTSNEYSPSGWFVGKKYIRANYDSDAAQSEPSVGFAGRDDDYEEVSSARDCAVEDLDGEVIDRDDCLDVNLTEKLSDDSLSRKQSEGSCCSAVSSEVKWRKRKVFAVRDFPAGCGVGVKAGEELSLETKNLGGQTRVPCIKRRMISAVRDFPAGCGVGVKKVEASSLGIEKLGGGTRAPCIKRRKISAIRDFPIGCGPESQRSVRAS